MKDAKQYIDPREVLIRFYTQKIGPDYAKDKIFCRIIACMDNGIINKIPTEYRSFITKVTKDAGKQTNGMLNQVRKKTGNKNGHFESSRLTPSGRSMNRVSTQLSYSFSYSTS